MTCSKYEYTGWFAKDYGDSQKTIASYLQSLAFLSLVHNNVYDATQFIALRCYYVDTYGNATKC